MLGLKEKKKITKYFNLDDEITSVKNRIEEIRNKFYETTMVTHTVYTDLGIMSQGFDMEKETNRLIDCLFGLDEKIRDFKKRKKYLKSYLNNLCKEEKDYLINKYKNNYEYKDTQADIDLYNEIQEIEEAINFMNGIEPEPEEITVLDNNKLEDDFSSIIRALGV